MLKLLEPFFVGFPFSFFPGELKQETSFSYPLVPDQMCGRD